MRPVLISSALGLRAGLYQPAEVREKVQLARLQRLIHHAYSNVPYYRELMDSVGFKPRHLCTARDLEAIPVTSREALQQAPKETLIARGRSLDRLRRSHTGGSTGVPVEVYRNRQEHWLRCLVILRAFRHNGLRFTDRVLTISRAKSKSINNFDIRYLPYLKRWDLSYFENEKSLVRTFAQARPTVLYGSAARVSVLASLIKEQCDAPVPLRLVATSAESLTAGDRSLIRAAFKSEPFEIYNCTELSDIAWQCSTSKRYHINADWLHVEIVRDGQNVRTGESGEIVVTNLYRYAMPLIRYSPGDLGTAAAALCDCGVQLPVLDSLDGRIQAIVILPNGARFTGFPRILGKFSEIRRFQVVQNALDQFDIKIVPVGAMPAELLQQIEQSVGSALGADVHVRAQVVELSRLIQGVGKFRPVIPLPPDAIAARR